MKNALWKLQRNNRTALNVLLYELSVNMPHDKTFVALSLSLSHTCMHVSLSFIPTYICAMVTTSLPLTINLSFSALPSFPTVVFSLPQAPGVPSAPPSTWCSFLQGFLSEVFPTLLLFFTSGTISSRITHSDSVSLQSPPLLPDIDFSFNTITNIFVHLP